MGFFFQKKNHFVTHLGTGALRGLPRFAILVISRNFRRFPQLSVFHDLHFDGQKLSTTLKMFSTIDIKPKLWKTMLKVVENRVESCGKSYWKLWKIVLKVVENQDESCGKSKRKLWKIKMKVVKKSHRAFILWCKIQFVLL